MDPDGPLGTVEALHAAVDRAAEPLERRHANRLQCRRGCSDCCIDDIRVFEVEARRIREAHPDLLAEGLPHPPGRCAFLDAEGACRIYASRPYVCRTQGLPLRWTEERGAEWVELRDICPLNVAGGAPVERLPAEDCWTLGPWEGRLAELQRGEEGGAMRRVALRELFRAHEPPASG